MGIIKSRGLSPDGLESQYRRDGMPYRPTTRDARKALPSEVEVTVKAGANRVREIVSWENTVDANTLEK